MTTLLIVTDIVIYSFAGDIWDWIFISSRRITCIVLKHTSTTAPGWPILKDDSHQPGRTDKRLVVSACLDCYQVTALLVRANQAVNVAIDVELHPAALNIQGVKMLIFSSIQGLHITKDTHSGIISRNLSSIRIGRVSIAGLNRQLGQRIDGRNYA
jgi:hypothetical protein